MSAIVINKGDRVTAEWLEERPRGSYSLAGAGPKVAAKGQRVTGTVAHVRGDDPASPTQVTVFIDPEGEWDGPLMRPPGCKCERMHVGFALKRMVEHVPKAG